MFSTFILQHTEMFESIFSKSILSIVLRGTNYLCVLFCFVLFFFGGGVALPISSKNRRSRTEGSLPPSPPNSPQSPFLLPFLTIPYPFRRLLCRL